MRDDGEAYVKRFGKPQQAMLSSPAGTDGTPTARSFCFADVQIGETFLEDRAMSVELRHLEILYGTEGARQKFEQMTIQLISSDYPSIEKVRVHCGDGGIDAHDGKLSDALGLDVFQVKYFPVRIDESQKNQIRQAFKRVRENSGYVAKSWTLCLPIDMSEEEKRWFDDWKTKQADSNIEIRQIWGATKIEGLLMRSDNRGIREEFFKQENPQHHREMVSRVDRLVDEFVARIPIPEKIELTAVLESVNVISVYSDYEGGAWVHLQARFRVKNNSRTKTAHNWKIEIELTKPPPSLTSADCFRVYRNEPSEKVILPADTGMKNVEFGFHLLNNSPFRYQLDGIAYPGLRDSKIRFRTVSEDSIGEPQSQ